MPKYRLKNAFFDGERYHPKGIVIELEKGKAPSSAELVDPAVPATPLAETETKSETETGTQAPATVVGSTPKSGPATVPAKA